MASYMGAIILCRPTLYVQGKKNKNIEYHWILIFALFDFETK